MRRNELTKPEGSTKSGKWNTSSKFNSIINNLERTILSQFQQSQQHQNQHQLNRPHNDNVNEQHKPKQSAIKSSVRQKLNSLSSSFSSQHDNSTSRSKMIPKHSRVSNEQQVQNDTTTSDHGRAFAGLTLQSNKGQSSIERNTTLNKYQKQIVSTLRSSQNLLNNKLSIPPPHASDEARNENQRILFGSISNEVDKSCENLLNHRANASGQNTHSLVIDTHKINNQETSDNERRSSNLSPASSARSLPNIAIKAAAAATGSQTMMASACYDYESSGYTNYQPRRSFMLNDNRFPPTPLVPVTKPLGDMPQPSNLKHMQYSNSQSPSQPVTYNDNNFKNSSSMTQPPPSFVQSQVVVSSSNQVPIPHLTSMKGYPTVGGQQRQNIPLYNVSSAVYNNHGQILQTPTRIESGQQIYANAPPKPRRYQYYDQNQLPFQQNAQINYNTATNGAYHPLNGLHRYQQQNQLPYYALPEQHIIRSRYTEQSNLGHVIYEQSNHNGSIIPLGTGPINSLPPQSSIYGQTNMARQNLIRSKSSLDGPELWRFKNNRNSAYNSTQSDSATNSNTQRIDTDIKQGIVDQNQEYSQSTLSRSKSVTHLGPNVINPNISGVDPQNRHSLVGNSELTSHSSISTSNINRVGIDMVNLKPSLTQIQPSRLNNSSIVHGTLQSEYIPPRAYTNNDRLNNSDVYQQQDSSQRQANNSQVDCSKMASSAIGEQFTQSHNRAHFAPHTSPNIIGLTGNNHLRSDIGATMKNGSFVRQIPHSSNPQEAFAKLSLDDKIKSLLCDTDCGSHAIYQQSEDGNKQQTGTRGESYTKASGNHLDCGKNMNVDISEDENSNKTDVTQKQQQAQTDFSGRVFIDETSGHNMGNRQSHQYPATLGRAPKSHCENVWKNDHNSQLVVDLTTPRVLAKTQTTLLPPSPCARQPDLRKGSCSINQVGLPFIPPQQQQLLNDSKRPSDSCQNLVRSAPYYYSDLKSDEQRRALMNIVQQKSLSPPPKLLSRSIDQSSTRLVSRNGNHQVLTRGSNHAKPIDGIPGIHGSTSIEQNIDRIFEGSQRRVGGTHHSMLALNIPIGISKQSDGVQIDYYQDDPSSMNKSKSLENITHLGKVASSENGPVNRPRNPVYENISRIDHGLTDLNGSKRNTDLICNNSESMGSSAGSVESMIVSSSEASDESFNALDEIRVPSTGNHHNDIVQYIEKLKANHLRLSEEYISTQVRISSTLNKRNGVPRDCPKKEKLIKHLNALERRSKRYELRSKNQLALIQMMEKMLEERGLIEDKARCGQLRNSKTHDDKKTDSPIKEVKDATIAVHDGGSSPKTLIKAVVTESESPGRFGSTEMVGTSITPNDNDSYANNYDLRVSNTSIEMLDHNSRITGNEILNEADKSVIDSASGRSERQGFNGSGSDLMRDDDDFMEFISSENNHRSQYGASQFDASQFTTASYNNNSTSASETSGVGKDSLNSPNSISEPKLINGTYNGGILKKRNNSDDQSNNRYGSDFDDSNNNPSNPGKGKFNDILGNVVDVDVCSVNLSQC